MAGASTQQENMDPRLYKAASEGDVALLQEGDSPPDPTLSCTPQKNTALHIAVKSGHETIVKETQMIPRWASLISKTNFKGDTPLHMAARAGHLRVTQLLTPTLEEGTSWGNGATASEVWTMKNLEGNTALHEALKRGHEEVALHLLRLEKRLAHEVNDAKESPLYLAAEAGLLEVVNEILHGGEFSMEGPDGQNPLHIAAIKGRLEVVEILLNHAPHSNQNNFIRMVDDFGKTALHYASTIGCYGDVNSEVQIRTEILALLLKANPSLAYVPDKNGDYPLLIATIKAPFTAVTTILDHCPDSAELINKEGQNALHLAVRKKSEAVLQYLITRPEFQKIINEPDEEGNTPMHLATKTNSKEIVELLFHCEGVDLAVTNKNGLTALDMCGDTKEQLMMRDTLRKFGAVPSRHKWQELSFLPLHPPPPPLVLPSPVPTLFVSISSNLKSAAQTLPIVTTLIATVTFAAAFTMPGGYKNDGLDEGMPVFIRKAALKAFVLSLSHFVAPWSQQCCSSTPMPVQKMTS
ncbi:hypothetical protein MRB53_021212 [Persea americana]|uniref:Uncharacterized protein n=1 Tax=Persea americana TaxID=3435 RepID=A0ACC2L3S7_PERAE|nr:hypothetical protein MRB53_021212 [Persea americana]